MTTDRGRSRSAQRALGYEFADVALLRQALAHRSWCAEVPARRRNERLEFLGDAVLGWVVADLAYRQHGDLPEGKLTDLRKSVVNAVGARRAWPRSSTSGHALLLGKGEAAAGGRTKPSILSDALEAVIGAVYLDGGAEAGYDFVERLLGRPARRARVHAARTALDSQDRAAGADRAPVRRRPGVRAARRGPRPRQALLRHGAGRRRRAGARARDGRRSRPSRRLPARRSSAAGRAVDDNRRRCDRRLSAPAVPELPEVETVRRGSRARVVGRRIERGRGRAASAPCGARRARRVIDGLTGTTMLSAAAGGASTWCARSTPATP